MAKNPPDKLVKSAQLDLFSQFVGNSDDELSNTLELWEAIPKYFFTPKQVTALRTESGHADPFKWGFDLNSRSWTVQIQPALIEQKDGRYLACFPGVTEELVEESLKRILTIQNSASHDPEKKETWVRFTLQQVRKDLSEQGKGRNIREIRNAIEVMAKSVVTVKSGNKEVWSGTILQDLVTVGREEYEANSDSQHIARLPLFVSFGINTLNYRQFNYVRLMRCKEQLARWIYKRLINRFTYAHPAETHHFMFSDLKSNSGLLQQASDSGNRRKMKAALDELVKVGVLASYTTDEEIKGRSVVDVKYVVRPTKEFTKEQKASNKRHKSSIEKATKSQLSIVDNSL